MAERDGFTVSPDRRHLSLGTSTPERLHVLLLLLAALLAGWPARAQSVRELLPGGTQLNPAAVSNGSDFLVVWEEFRGQASDILGVRLNRDNLLRDTSPIAVSAAVHNQSNPALAFLPPYFVCVWDDRREGGFGLRAARIDGSGAVLDPEGIVVRQDGITPQPPTVAAGRSEFLIVWQEAAPDSGSCILGARLTAAGALLDSTPIRVCPTPGRQAHCRVAFDSDRDNYCIVWEQHSPNDDSVTVQGARVSADGVVRDTQPVRLCRARSRQTSPSIAYYDGPTAYHSCLVVWQDDRTDMAGIYGKIIDSTLAAPDTLGGRLSEGSLPQMNPMVSEDESLGWDLSYGVTWEEKQSGGGIGVRYAILAGTWPWLYPAAVEPDCDLRMPCYAGGGPHHPFSRSAIAFVKHRHDFTRPSTIARTWLEVLGLNPALASPVPAVSAMVVTPSVANQTCTVDWRADRAACARVQVLDAGGRRIAERDCGMLPAGEHRVTLNLAGTPPGAWFVRLTAGQSTRIARLLVLR